MRVSNLTKCANSNSTSISYLLLQSQSQFQAQSLRLAQVRVRSSCSSVSTSSARPFSTSSTLSNDSRPSSSSASSHAEHHDHYSNFPASFGANQVLPLTSNIQSRLLTIHNHFKAPIQFAFAYGSGVFSQKVAGPEHAKKPKTKDGKKMLDFIMAVNHPQHWHAINLNQNKHHYSTLSRWLGSGMIEKVQKLGAGIWYLPYVKVGDELIKYGVIDIDTLCQDLLDWDTLYVSGRMHKPVAILASDPRVRLAQQVNLSSALRVAQLLLPSKFTEVELYSRIASLSYEGDFRMSVPGGENADKVRNIVLGQREEFRRLYAGLVRSMGTMKIEERRKDRYIIEQDTTPEVRADHASKLPRNLRSKIQSHYTSQPSLHPSFLALSLHSKSDVVTRKPISIPAHASNHLIEKAEKEEARRLGLKDLQAAFWLEVVQRPDFNQVLLKEIATIVKGPATLQSLKGIYTAGFGRTLKYVAAKVGKYFDGKNKRKDQDSSREGNEKNIN